MADFPGTLPTITRPADGDSFNDGSATDGTVWADEVADEIEAIAAKVGATSSAVTTSHDYLLAHGVMANEFSLRGDISPSQITANQNDYNPTGLSTASTLRLNTDASRNITGLQGGADGRIILIHNIGSFDIVLVDQSGLSTGLNRFELGGANITLVDNTSIALQYDSTTQRWRPFSYPPSTAAGAPTTVDYLVGTASGSLSGEIIAGTSPGGELGGTWGSPTVDSVHSGSAHHAQSHGDSDHSGELLPGGSISGTFQFDYLTSNATAGSAESDAGLSFDIEANVYYAFDLAGSITGTTAAKILVRFTVPGSFAGEYWQTVGIQDGGSSVTSASDSTVNPLTTQDQYGTFNSQAIRFGLGGWVVSDTAGTVQWRIQRGAGGVDVSVNRGFRLIAARLTP